MRFNGLEAHRNLVTVRALFEFGLKSRVHSNDLSVCENELVFEVFFSPNCDLSRKTFRQTLYVSMFTVHKKPE